MKKSPSVIITHKTHKKLSIVISVCLVLSLLLSCSLQPREYPFKNKGITIENVELLCYPYYFNRLGDRDSEERMEFFLIRKLQQDEIPTFMEEIYSLDTNRVRTAPSCDYGRYIARVNYENGDTEYFGSFHIEFVESGKQPKSIGRYYFTGYDFEELFFEYAIDISQLEVA